MRSLKGCKTLAGGIDARWASHWGCPSTRCLTRGAAEALGHISDKRATDSLIKSLEDVSVEVRFWAAFALGEIGDPKAIPELKRLAARDSAILPHWGSVSLEAQKAINRIRRSS